MVNVRLALEIRYNKRRRVRRDEKRKRKRLERGGEEGEGEDGRRGDKKITNYSMQILDGLHLRVSFRYVPFFHLLFFFFFSFHLLFSSSNNHHSVHVDLVPVDGD